MERRRVSYNIPADNNNKLKDPKTKWKDLQENYDSHLDRKVSRHVHRGDLTSTSRLLGYTDAMMATCATFLIIPIRHIKQKHDSTTAASSNNEHSAAYQISNSNQHGT